MINQTLSQRATSESDAIGTQSAELPRSAMRWCPAADGERRGGGETILLVEDEAFVREVTREVLRSAGYKVLTAKDVTEADGAYDGSGGGVELLLTDVILPGETGKVLAMRLTKENPGLKVLFVTGYAEQMRLGEGEQTECLAKPFSTVVLLRRVREILDRGGIEPGKKA